MKNWKTTAGGIVAAIGLILANQTNPTMRLIGLVLAPVAVALTGIAASDGKPSV